MPTQTKTKPTKTSSDESPLLRETPAPARERVTRPSPHTLHPVSKFFWHIRYFMPLISIGIVAGGTYLAVQFGKGYRPTLDGRMQGTGLLAANSFPPGAEVYLDGKLTTATDDTLNLPPIDYTVTIKKDGYLPWEKRLSLQKELVTQTNATLFKSVGSLTPLTLSGATNITPSPDGQKIAFVVATASATTKNGLYVADLTSSLLSLQKGPRQIAKAPTHFDLTKATFLWSPNSAQLLVHAETKSVQYNYILESDKTSDFETLHDVTPRLSIIFSEWEEDIVLRETKQFALLPGAMQQIATASATNVYFSPNEDRIMYTATEYAQIPAKLLPKPPSPNTQKETRSLEPEHLYVYDLTEDRNYDLGPISLPVSSVKKRLLLATDYQQSPALTATQSGSPVGIPLTSYVRLQDTKDFQRTVTNFRVHYSSIFVDGFQWYPNSTHVLITQKDKVEVIEFDSTNRQTVYSGPFTDHFVYPWPDGSRLIILTNLNPASVQGQNLYTVDIR